MSFRNILIRTAANIIYLLRRSAIQKSDLRFVVFTGTSGKTLARSAATYAFRKRGFSAVSPPFGYTNELGIVLAALGIESVRLLGVGGLRRIFSAHPEEGAYVCIELGADWRRDIPWFLARFSPYGVCITSVDPRAWTRSLADIWNDKKALIDAIRGDGFLLWSQENPSKEKIRALVWPGIRSEEFTGFESESRLLHDAQALGCAAACLRMAGDREVLLHDFFDAYPGVSERVSKTELASGALLIADTYKAIPQCAEYVLKLGLGEPIKKKTAVISALHPLWQNEELHYARIAGLLKGYDVVYFVGPEYVFRLLSRELPHIVHMGESDYEKTARDILKKSDRDTLIVIKGAGRYHLSRLVAMLRD